MVDLYFISFYKEHFFLIVRVAVPTLLVLLIRKMLQLVERDFYGV